MNDICKLWKWYWSYNKSSDGFIMEDITTPEESRRGLVIQKPIRRNSSARALLHFLTICGVLFIVIPGLSILMYCIFPNKNFEDNFQKEVYFIITVMYPIILICGPLCVYAWNEFQNIIGNIDDR
jgi:hypothetical protein